MTTFCTYLTIYRGNKLPPFYIGSSSVKRVENGYRGSVSSKKYQNIWKEELKANPNKFKTFIIKVFNTRVEASDHEANMQRKLQVHKNPLYINQALFSGSHIIYSRSGKNSACYGRKQTFEEKEKRSKSLKGRPKSEEHKQKISRSLTGRTGHLMSDENKLKASIRMRNRAVSDETKQKLSDNAKARYQTNPESHPRLNTITSTETRQKISNALKGRSGTFKNKIHTSETKQKLSDNAKARYQSEEYRVKINKARYRKKVTQFTVDMQFVKEWESVKKAAEHIGCRSSDISVIAARADQYPNRTCRGFIWRY